ncbi:MAG: hypothetical protein Ct9H90mP3_8480 [Flammeovirgaceae bacterium]|nr:MAG: hypothetical protein Ct9H90mP3_8480 [Flammeovirgaceae bacterium]
MFLLKRAAAKNFSDVVLVSSRSQYSKVLKYLLDNNFFSDINFRKKWPSMLFSEVSNYDLKLKNISD